MLIDKTLLPLTEAQRHAWEQDGYMIVRGLWTAEEIAAVKARFDEIAEAGEAIDKEGVKFWEADTTEPVVDPLKRYPRVMQPHRHDELSLRMLLDERIGSVLGQLMDEEPIATQTMYYFKPSGARGQALHQDNFYLRVRPKSCVAAWTAVDPALEDNGGLLIAPGTHTMEVVCPDVADPNESFAKELVTLPNGQKLVPAIMDPGDVLFFNGSVVHGSKPNTHPTLWRRSFISHYAPASTIAIGDWYFPLLDFAGNPVDREVETGAGPCGTDFDMSTAVTNGKWA